MKTFTLLKRGDDARVLPDTAAGWRERPYYFKFSFRGTVYARCLETPDAKEAQRRARLIHQQITTAVAADRWADLDATKIKRPSAATVGDILALYRQHARCKSRTVQNNIDALQYVARRALRNDALDLPTLPLSTFTRKLAREFQDAMLAAAGDDLVAKGKAATNANSFLRQARSVFSSHAHNDMLSVYADSGLKMPETLDGFRKFPLLREPSHKFKPAAADTMRRVLAALPALKAEDPDSYRIFLLAYGCGLRRGEIVHLRGSDISHTLAPNGGEGPGEGAARHTIHLRTRADWQTKTGEERTVPMEPHVWAELVSLDPMLAAPRSADPVAPLPDYLLTGSTVAARLAHFRRFGAWLASLGWTATKKAHQLRKEWETLAVIQHGAPVAAALAGHSVEVQQKHYFGLGEDVAPVKIFGT